MGQAHARPAERGEHRVTQGTLGTHDKTFEVTSYGCLPSPQRTVDLGFVQASVTPEGTEFRLSPNPPIDGARTAEGGKGVTSAMMGA